MTRIVTTIGALLALLLTTACGANLSDSAVGDGTKPESAAQSPFPSSAMAPSSYSVVQLDKLTPSQQVAATTLQGLLARSSGKQIYTLVADDDAHDLGGGRLWLQRSGVANTACGCEGSSTAFWSWVSSMWAELGSAPKTFVGYDLAANQQSVNSANSLTGVCNSLAVDASDAAEATKVGFTQRVDASNLSTQDLITTYGAQGNPCGTTLATNVAIELDPRSIYGGGPRDYATLTNALVFFDIKGNGIPNLSSALRYVEAPSPIMGWGDPDQMGESAYVSATGSSGNFYVAADWARNLSVLSGLASVTPPKPIPAAKPIAPKPTSASHIPKGATAGVNATFLMSDGDNLQWLLGRGNSPQWWGNAQRGKVPMGWSMSTALYYLAPTAWNYYVETATDNDGFFTGPSGIGYTFGNVTTNQSAYQHQIADLNRFAGTAHLPTGSLFGSGDWNNTTFLSTPLGQQNVKGSFYFEYAGWITPASEYATKWFDDKPVIPANEYLDRNSWAGDLTQGVINDLCSTTPKNNGIYAIYTNAWGNNNNPMDLIKAVSDGVASTCPNYVNLVTPDGLVAAATAAKSSVTQTKPSEAAGPKSKPLRSTAPRP